MTEFRLADKIKIDVVSDVVCPWCIIGYKRLKQAISEMGIEDKVEIEWQPFELNPQMPPEGENIDEHIARKYGSTPEARKQSITNLTTLGKDVGFTFDFFDGMRIFNTLDAHILNDYAKEHGKQSELNLRFIEAYFSKQLDISNTEVLLNELEAVGLDAKEALARLNDGKRKDAVLKNATSWKNRGINGVPTIVFNNTSGVTGAQSVAVYKQVLTDLLQ